MTPTVAEVQDGQIVRGPFATPRAWNGTTFATNADANTYRTFGLWPVEDATADPEPWQRVDSISYTVDTQAQTVFRNRTYADRELATVQVERVERLRQTRDDGIQAGFSYTFSDGTTAALPTAIPNEAVRMQALAFRCDRLERAGNGSTTVQFEDLNGQDVVQPASEVADAVEAAVSRFQQWHDSFTTHKQNVFATATAEAAYEYDPSANGGWPS